MNMIYKETNNFPINLYDDASIVGTLKSSRSSWWGGGVVGVEIGNTNWTDNLRDTRLRTEYKKTG